MRWRIALGYWSCKGNVLVLCPRGNSDHLTEKLILAANGNPELIRAENEKSLSKIPQVESSGSSNISMSVELARIFLLNFRPKI